MKETTESNRLIAEFMGMPKCGRCEDCGAYQYSAAVIYQPEDMKYHTSWDWLMPVVEKIDSLGDFTLVKIERNYCQIVNQNAPLISIASESKISAVYTAVIQFIQWYNTHNKK